MINGADELVKAAERGDLAQMKALLDDWVAMYAMENAGGRALRAAAAAGRADSLRFLFAQSDTHPHAELRQTTRAAAWYGHPDALEVILAQVMDQESKQALVQEALGLASQAGMAKVLPLLLSAGANANAPTSEWEPRTPLALAEHYQHKHVVRALNAGTRNR